MGGDGSILRVAHTYADLDAAILGINLGHLGFMADVQINAIIPCLEDLIDGKFLRPKQDHDRRVCSKRRHFLCDE